MKIALISKNKYLGRRLELLFDDGCVVMLDTVRDLPDGAKIIIDTDTVDERVGGALLFASDGTEALGLPLCRADIEAAGGEARLTLDKQRSVCRLDGEEIRLTEVECALLSALISRGGGFVSRDTLLSEVWGGMGSGSLINVYIHYLREKLEARGEKVIISSRKEGYAISEKFVLGGALC